MQVGLGMSRHQYVQVFCQTQVATLLYGLVSYPGSLTLTSSGRCKIRWLNLILEVVAAILAA